MLEGMKVLVTGGAGYIGSTTCSALEDAGHTPIVLDSLITGPAAFVQGRTFYEGRVGDRALLQRVFDEHPDITATLHFAARIVVSESVAQPGLYYQENVVESLILFETLQAMGQSRVVFSSSASLYDSPPNFCVTEDSPLRPLSPYARSKWMNEMMLEDICRASALRGLALRYFNPIGADPQARSGPYQKEATHILGRLMAAIQGGPPAFSVTGTDYSTRDGTGLRDYVHVWDLALAHVAAVERFDQVFERARAAGNESPVYLSINVGTGTGVTVRELVTAFQEVFPAGFTVQDAPRRPGDSAGAYADTTRAREWLGWEPRHTTTQALASLEAWQEVRDIVLQQGDLKQADESGSGAQLR